MSSSERLKELLGAEDGRLLLLLLMRFPPDVSTVGDCVVLGLEISQLSRGSQARISAGNVFKSKADCTRYRQTRAAAGPQVFHFDL